MSDTFQSFADNPIAPSRAPFAVVPHDANALTRVAKSLFVGTGGNITLRGAGGSADVLFKNVPNGATLPVQASHVRATGTTAQDIVAL